MFLNSVHLNNYLAGMYLNTQEADTKCMKLEPTDPIFLLVKGHMYLSWEP